MWCLCVLSCGLFGLPRSMWAGALCANGSAAQCFHFPSYRKGGLYENEAGIIVF